MVRLIAHSLLVAPLLAEKFHDNHFTAMPYGERRNNNEAACDDVLKEALKSDPKGWTIDEAATKADCQRISGAEIDCNKETCKWYDETWRSVKTKEAATASFDHEGWYTCTGADVCFSGLDKQHRFKHNDMCKKLAPQVVSASLAQFYSVEEAMKDCQKALSDKQTIDPSNKIIFTPTSQFCTIDSLDQTCATALAVSDELEIKLRKGCEPKKCCKKGASLTECVKELGLLSGGKTEFDRYEYVFEDDANEHGSRNEKVSSMQAMMQMLEKQRKAHPGTR